MRIIDDGQAFCGRCFVCESSSADYAKGYVGKEAGGYWKDEKTFGNVFVKISAVQIVEEDEREPAKWKKMQLSNAQKTEVALKFGWPSEKITPDDVYLDGKTNMLSIVHLEMCEWMSRRDLDVPVREINKKMAFFAPSLVANAFARIDHMKDQDIIFASFFGGFPGVVWLVTLGCAEWPLTWSPTAELIIFKNPANGPPCRN